LRGRADTMHGLHRGSPAVSQDLVASDTSQTYL
jgi:hypothetical protein